MNIRFKEMIAEIENLPPLCPTCRIPLQIAKFEKEEIGNNAAIPMCYCEECGSYFIARSFNERE